jgi:hypothetical protein
VSTAADILNAIIVGEKVLAELVAITGLDATTIITTVRDEMLSKLAEPGPDLAVDYDTAKKAAEGA